MLNKSAHYNTIFSNDDHYAQVKMLVDGTYYDESVIRALTTNYAMADQWYTLGNVVINQFQATLEGLDETDIHRYSEVDLFVRYAVEGGSTTNWLPKGKFIVAEADYDTESGIMQVMGYDFLCKGEVIPYPAGDTSVSSWTGETMRTVATRMATLLNIPLEDDTQVSQEDYPAPPFDFTIREILADIALMGCGNWYLTYVNSGNETSPVASPKLRLWHTTDTGTTTALGRDVTAFEELPQTDGVAEVEIVYGYNSEGVKLVKTATGTGSTDVSYEVKTIPDGTVMQTLANKLASNYLPSTYQPFTATGGELDMACELGDPISCNSHTAVLVKVDTVWNVGMWSSLSAPTITRKEEFKYTPQSQRQVDRVERDTATNTARITVNADSIQAEVIRATSAESDLNDNLRTTITQTATEIMAEVSEVATDLNDHATEQLQYIRYSAEGLELGESASSAKAKLSPRGLELISPDSNLGAAIEQDPQDGNYKLFVYGGHFVNYSEIGDNWLMVSSSDANDNRLTFKARG